MEPSQDFRVHHEGDETPPKANIKTSTGVLVRNGRGTNCQGGKREKKAVRPHTRSYSLLKAQSAEPPRERKQEGSWPTQDMLSTPSQPDFIDRI